MSKAARKRRDSRGFTIVEMAIILVVIGLLLGGILKGSELINNAKVRALTDRTTSYGIAFRSFITRYHYPPGDLRSADTYLGLPSNPSPGSARSYLGDGNQVIGVADAVTGTDERALAFTHLANAGLIKCSPPACTGRFDENETWHFPQNLYGGGFEFRDKLHNRQYLRTIAEDRPRFYVSTGLGIPSTILSEIDRKIDDGYPSSGDFRSQYNRCTVSAVRSTTGEVMLRTRSFPNPPDASAPDRTLLATGITHHEWEHVNEEETNALICAAVLLL